MKKIVDLDAFGRLYCKLAKRIDGEDFNSGVGFAANMFKHWLDAQPDAEEVKHGKWEFRNDEFYGRRRAYCSACGKRSGIGGIKENQLKPYCPNCGAKMDLGEEE